jgi:hypothetical protein
MVSLVLFARSSVVFVLLAGEYMMDIDNYPEAIESERWIFLVNLIQ